MSTQVALLFNTYCHSYECVSVQPHYTVALGEAFRIEMRLPLDILCQFDPDIPAFEVLDSCTSCTSCTSIMRMTCPVATRVLQEVALSMFGTVDVVPEKLGGRTRGFEGEVMETNNRI